VRVNQGRQKVKIQVTAIRNKKQNKTDLQNEVTSNVEKDSTTNTEQPGSNRIVTDRMLGNEVKCESWRMGSLGRKAMHFVHRLL